MRARSALTVVALATMLVAACGGPTTKDEVCDSFDALGTQLLQGNGILGNPLFHKAKALADIAGRYDGDPDLSGDADRLQDIADSDSTSGLELMNATARIAELCGHPLSTNALFGR
jgi:hypothetical protein